MRGTSFIHSGMVTMVLVKRAIIRKGKSAPSFIRSLRNKIVVESEAPWPRPHRL